MYVRGHLEYVIVPLLASDGAWALIVGTDVVNSVGTPLAHDLALLVHQVLIRQDPCGEGPPAMMAAPVELDVVKRIQRVLDLRAKLRRHRALDAMSADDKQRNVIRALEDGLLKIMSKMGISVLRSYRSAKLFCAVGLGPEIIGGYFRGLTSPVGGLGLNRLAEIVMVNTASAESDAPASSSATHTEKRHPPDGKRKPKRKLNKTPRARGGGGCRGSRARGVD